MRLSQYLSGIQEETCLKDLNINNLRKWHKALTQISCDESHSNRILLMQCIIKFVDYVINYVSLVTSYRDQISVCRKCFKCITDIVSDFPDIFVQEMTMHVFEIIIEEDVKNWCMKKELLKIFNSCIQNAAKTVRRETVENLSNIYLLKMVDSISIYGDYDLQAILVETIFRLYGKQTITSRLKELIPESQEISQSLADIDPKTFDEDVRTFLNSLNQTSDKVLSVLATRVQLGEVLCIPPMANISGIWIDFNLSDGAISWYCANSSFTKDESQNSEDDRLWNLITIFTDDVKAVMVHRLVSDPYFIISFTLEKPCISLSEDVQEEMDKITNLTLCFENSEASTNLVSKIMPTLFGKKLVDDNIQKKVSKPSRGYQPLNIEFVKKPKASKSKHNATMATSYFNPTTSTTTRSETISSALISDCTKNNKTENSENCAISIHSSLSSDLFDPHDHINGVVLLSGRCTGSNIDYGQYTTKKISKFIQAVPDTSTENYYSAKETFSSNVAVVDENFNEEQSILCETAPSRLRIPQTKISKPKENVLDELSADLRSVEVNVHGHGNSCFSERPADADSEVGEKENHSSVLEDRPVMLKKMSKFKQAIPDTSTENFNDAQSVLLETAPSSMGISQTKISKPKENVLDELSADLRSVEVNADGQINSSPVNPLPGGNSCSCERPADADSEAGDKENHSSVLDDEPVMLNSDESKRSRATDGLLNLTKALPGKEMGRVQLEERVFRDIQANVAPGSSKVSKSKHSLFDNVENHSGQEEAGLEIRAKASRSTRQVDEADKENTKRARKAAVISKPKFESGVGGKTKPGSKIDTKLSSIRKRKPVKNICTEVKRSKRLQVKEAVGCGLKQNKAMDDIFKKGTEIIEITEEHASSPEPPSNDAVLVPQNHLMHVQNCLEMVPNKVVEIDQFSKSADINNDEIERDEVQNRTGEITEPNRELLTASNTENRTAMNDQVVETDHFSKSADINDDAIEKDGVQNCNGELIEPNRDLLPANNTENTAAMNDPCEIVSDSVTANQNDVGPASVAIEKRKPLENIESPVDMDRRRRNLVVMLSYNKKLLQLLEDGKDCPDHFGKMHENTVDKVDKYKTLDKNVQHKKSRECDKTFDEINQYLDEDEGQINSTNPVVTIEKIIEESKISKETPQKSVEEFSPRPDLKNEELNAVSQAGENIILNAITKDPRLRLKKNLTFTKEKLSASLKVNTDPSFRDPNQTLSTTASGKKRKNENQNYNDDLSNQTVRDPNQTLSTTLSSKRKRRLYNPNDFSYWAHKDLDRIAEVPETPTNRCPTDVAVDAVRTEISPGHQVSVLKNHIKDTSVLNESVQFVADKDPSAIEETVIEVKEKKIGNIIRGDTTKGSRKQRDAVAPKKQGRRTKQNRTKKDEVTYKSVMQQEKRQKKITSVNLNSTLYAKPRRSDHFRSCFEDMLQSFREEIGGRTLLEELHKRDVQTPRKQNVADKRGTKRRASEGSKRITLRTANYRARRRSSSSSSSNSDVVIRKRVVPLESTHKLQRPKLNLKILNKRPKKESAKINILSDVRIKPHEVNVTPVLLPPNPYEIDTEPFEEGERTSVRGGRVDETRGTLRNSSVSARVLETENRCSILVAYAAPHWESMAVIKEEFVRLRSEDFVGKYLVLFFFPLDFGFHPNVQPPLEILSFNNLAEDFKRLNAEVVACSVDSQYTHHAWVKYKKEEGSFQDLKIPLLSDANHKISKAYNVYIEEWGYTLRSVVIVHPNGRLIHQSTVDAAFTVNADDVLRLIKYYQMAEQLAED